MLERVLVVGFGSIGRRHVRLVRELIPTIQVVVLRHRTCPDSNDSGVDHCVTRLDKALQLRPQAAVIANPASEHLHVALPLAHAGVHLLIEKPISKSVDHVSELIDTCRARDIALMVGYNLRFLPSLQLLREALQSKRIGRILSVRAEIGQFLPSWRPDSDYRLGVSARAELGGGVLLELSHEIDYLRWLFGEVVWVSAVQRKLGDLDIDVEDTAHLILGFEPQDGNTPVVASLNMDFNRHDTTRTCTVIGKTGTLRWDAVAGSVEMFEQGGNAWKTLFAQKPQQDESYRAEWRHFLTCIAEGARPVVSGDDGLAVLKIVEAARRSSGAGMVVSLEHEPNGRKTPGRTA